MNWDDLRIFLSVSRMESLTGAGKTLRLDPATVGRRIGRLEDKIGAILFVKSPQGYRLTEAGEAFLVRAEAAEQAVDGAISDMGQRSDGLTGSIRVGAPDGCATYLLPTVTRAIQAENPGLDIQIVALPRVFNLSKREADMAVAVSRPQTGRLRVKKISDYQLCLAASKDYFGRLPPITRVEHVRDHPTVGYIPDMIFDRELDYQTEIGLGQPDLASNLVSVQLGWLRAGAGIGVVHRFVLADHPELVPVLENEVSLTRSFWLIRHADDARIERMNAFAQMLSDGIRSEILRRSQS